MPLALWLCRMSITCRVEWVGAMAVRTALAAQHSKIDDKPESDDDKEGERRPVAAPPIHRIGEGINESERSSGAGEAQPDACDPEGMAAIIEPFDGHRERRKQKRQTPEQTWQRSRSRRWQR